MHWLTFLGALLVAVGTIGQSIKSKEESKELLSSIRAKDESIGELIAGKNTLIEKNQELSDKIDRYQKELEVKQQQINQLEKKVEPKLQAVQRPVWMKEGNDYQATAIFRSEISTKEVSNAEVQIEFDAPYSSAKYQIIPDNLQSALSVQEIYGAVGSDNAMIYKIGLYKLPANTALVITFRSEKPSALTKIIPE